MGPASKNSLPDWLPFLVGAVLVLQFLGLAAWQVSRGLDKRADHDAWSADSGFASFVDGMDVTAYQRLEAEGRFDADHQFVLDNITLESRNGHYVLTPLMTAPDEPLLIVNRGWVERHAERLDPAAIEVPLARTTVRGRVGSLPRPGYRMGESMSDDEWPRHALWPTLPELAAALGREVQPFVLLMDPEDPQGYVRHWVPEEFGPARHFGYAFQWLAMAVVLAALLVWHYRKRDFSK